MSNFNESELLVNKLHTLIIEDCRQQQPLFSVIHKYSFIFIILFI